jgi:hypothetical protein
MKKRTLTKRVENFKKWLQSEMVRSSINSNKKQVGYFKHGIELLKDIQRVLPKQVDIFADKK